MRFDIHRGTNISHWLSQRDWLNPSKDPGQERRAWFTRTDVQLLAGLGLDHLRIPVDEVEMWDEHRRRDAEAFGLLDAALDWCAEAGLRAIVDLHILRTHYFTDNPEQRLFTDPAETQRFAGLWTDLSAHLRRRPLDQVAYELMNEPVARDPADWNRVARAGYDAVRREEPDRTIVLGSNRWSMPASFHELAVPSGDRNLILTFHFYNPLPVTHYKAYWAPLAKYEGPVHYPGQPVPPHDWPHLRPRCRNCWPPGTSSTTPA